MRLHRLIILFIPLSLSCRLAVAAADTFSLNGYYKNFITAFVPPGYKSEGNQPARGAINNRLRLKFFWDSGSLTSFNLVYDFSPRFQAQSLFSNLPSFSPPNNIGGSYRVKDLNSPFYGPYGNFAIYQNLDRAFIKFKTNSADIYLGRQAIAWGSAKVIAPTDVLVPFRLEALDIEDRLGVDAIRVRWPTGTLSEIDAGYIAGKNFSAKESAVYLRDKFNLSGADISFLLLDFRQNFLAGFDLSRSIRGAGFWLETAYVFAENDYLRASTGFDYSFSDKTYGFIEYHFSGAGAGEPKNYSRNLSQPAFTDGAVYLLGKHYLGPGFNYQITPLLNFSGQVLTNLQNGSFFLSPQFDYNIFENIYLSLGAFAGVGKRPETVVENALPTTVFHSDFGGYPNIYFTSFRLYF